MIVEIDGYSRYYNTSDRITNQSPDFKYRLFDLYGLSYVRLEIWDHLKEAAQNTNEIDPVSVI